MNVLLHACCAPCSVKCVETLRREGLVPSILWFNPNIHPYTEYISRRDSLLKYCSEEELPLIYEGEYGLRTFLDGVSKTDTSRCEFCYCTRMAGAASVAKSRGFDAFTTTLLISPYQNHELLMRIGHEQGEKYGVEFLYRDFRPFFREGQAAARARGLYIQKYCGCIFSEEERYLGKKKKKEASAK